MTGDDDAAYRLHPVRTNERRAMAAEWMMTALFMLRLAAAELMYMWSNAGRGTRRPVSARQERDSSKGARKGMCALRLAVGFGLSTVLACVLLPRISGSMAGTTAGFILVFFATVLAAYYAYDCSFWTILFEAIAGYLTEHFVSQAFNLISYALEAAEISVPLSMLTLPILTSLTLYPLFYVLFGRQIRRGEHANVNNRRLIVLVGLGLFLCIALSVYPSSLQMTLLTESGIAVEINSVFHVYAMFGCLTSLMLLFGLRTEGEMKDRLLLAEHLLHLQQEQYRISRENIELINIKCHDLKHQIAALREHPDERSIREIEEAVRIYDATIQTGNNALDVILTEKSLYCSSHGIHFSCIADGESLDFMDPGDIYSLFGNIISNAAEALEQIEDESLREITLSIRRVGTYVVVLAQNPFEGELTFEKGLPQTRKRDRNEHGFGMLSIRSIVEKYAGQLMLRAQEGVFCVKAVFPAGESEES